MFSAALNYWYGEDSEKPSEEKNGPNGASGNANPNAKPKPRPPPPQRPPPPMRPPSRPKGQPAPPPRGSAPRSTFDIAQWKGHAHPVATAAHPYPTEPQAVHAKASHPYSLSTPLLREESSKERGRPVVYTFDPIKYHYEKCGQKEEGVQVVVAKEGISNSSPLKLAFEDLPSQGRFDFLRSLSGSDKGSPKSAKEKEKEAEAEPKTDADHDADTPQAPVSTETNDESKETELSVRRGADFMDRYFDGLPLRKSERSKLRELYEWVKGDKLSQRMSEDLCVGDLVISYFSHLSPTNPDDKGCWKRWITYRDDAPLKDVNFHRIREFFATGLFNVAYDKENRPVMVINTKHYDDTFGPEITAKAFILFVTSLLWDLQNNQYDFFALRKGVNVYVDLSHFSMNLLPWNVISAVKSAAIAYPFQLLDIYCVNTPTFIYLLKQIAGKVLVPHAMEKIKILSSKEEYITSYGIEERTPRENGGLWDITCTQWMRERGYVEDISMGRTTNILS